MKLWFKWEITVQKTPKEGETTAPGEKPWAGWRPNGQQSKSNYNEGKKREKEETTWSQKIRGPGRPQPITKQNRPPQWQTQPVARVTHGERKRTRTTHGERRTRVRHPQAGNRSTPNTFAKRKSVISIQKTQIVPIKIKFEVEPGHAKISGPPIHPEKSTRSRMTMRTEKPKAVILSKNRKRRVWIRQWWNNLNRILGLPTTVNRSEQHNVNLRRHVVFKFSFGQSKAFVNREKGGRLRISWREARIGSKRRSPPRRKVEGGTVWQDNLVPVLYLDHLFMMAQIVHQEISSLINHWLFTSPTRRRRRRRNSILLGGLRGNTARRRWRWRDPLRRRRGTNSLPTSLNLRSEKTFHFGACSWVFQNGKEEE